MGNFLFQVVEALLEVAKWAIIVQAILSWLIAFDVINVRNSQMRRFIDVLSRLVSPILAPFRRFIPTFGGVDVSPILALIIIQAAQTYLIPWLFRPLIETLGG